MGKSLTQQITDLGFTVTTEEEHTDEMISYVSSVLSQGKILDANAKIIDMLFSPLLGILMASLVTFAVLLGVAISGNILSIIFGVIIGLLTTWYAAYGIYDFAFQSKSKRVRLEFSISLVSMFSILVIASVLAIYGSQTAVLLSALGGFLLVATITLGEFLLFQKYGTRGSFRAGSFGIYEEFITVPPEMASCIQKIKGRIPNVHIYLTSGRSGIYKPFSAAPEKECVLYYYVINIGNEYVHVKGFWPEQRPFKEVVH